MKEQKTIPVVGTKLIEQYREEQISKHNWSVQHDIDINKDGQLILGAAAYLLGATPITVLTPSGPAVIVAEQLWPSNWSKQWLKLSDNKVKNLSKAGALVAAEIDRLLQTSDNVDLEELYKYARQQELLAEIRKVREEQVQNGLTADNLRSGGRFADAAIAYSASTYQRRTDDLNWAFWPFENVSCPEDEIEDKRHDILHAIALLVAELEDLEE